MEISQSEAERRFVDDVNDAEEVVNWLVKERINDNQFSALVSLIFNIGETQFRTSTLLRKLNDGDFNGAANEFDKWRKGGGKVLDGLVRRRAAERELFLSTNGLVS